MQGLLRDMAVADLIQHACQDGRTARLVITQRDARAEVFFENGRVVHAQMGADEGEQVVFAIFGWTDGSFSLEPAEPSPRRTILRSYPALLLEGARRVDEEGGHGSELIPADILIAPGPPPAVPAVEESMSELAKGLSKIEGVDGAVLVAEDGVVIGHNLQGDPDKEGAVAAFVGAAAVQAGETMSLGRFKRGSVASPSGTILILRHRDYYVGLLLAEGGSPSLVSSRAETYLEGGKPG